MKKIFKFNVLTSVLAFVIALNNTCFASSHSHTDLRDEASAQTEEQFQKGAAD